MLIFVRFTWPTEYVCGLGTHIFGYSSTAQRTLALDPNHPKLLRLWLHSPACYIVSAVLKNVKALIVLSSIFMVKQGWETCGLQAKCSS